MKRSHFNAVLSMLIFGTIGIFRRYIPLPSGILALSRGLLGALSISFLENKKEEKCECDKAFSYYDDGYRGGYRGKLGSSFREL